MDFDYYFNHRDIAVLKGKTITELTGIDEGSTEITFTCGDGTVYKMYHAQDDTEMVYVSDYKKLAGFTPPPDCLVNNPYGEDEPELREEWALGVIRDDALKQLALSPVTYAERIELDRELIVWSRRKSEPHEDMRGTRKTVFILANANVAVSITWSGISSDDRESTEIDFVQTHGKGTLTKEGRQE